VTYNTLVGRIAHLFRINADATDWDPVSLFILPFFSWSTLPPAPSTISPASGLSVPYGKVLILRLLQRSLRLLVAPHGWSLHVTANALLMT
jgi:hypothetical protein